VNIFIPEKHGPGALQRHVGQFVLQSDNLCALHSAVHQRIHHYAVLGVAIPALERLQKEGGEEGKKKIASITRYATVGIGLLMALRTICSSGTTAF
jgi:hypothetical protein